MKRHEIPSVELLAAQELAYGPLALTYSNLVQEIESQDYAACSFDLGQKHIKFRVAKITPTKVGQFVTFWKRIGNSPIMPYDMNDHFDFLIVSARSGNSFGQFVFPKNVLLQKGVLSKDGRGGKRAMRVYPLWDITDSSQAKKTQAWQLQYFVELQPVIDWVKIKKLFL
jgi:hypothetical protein